jgi:hypothetical protein
MYFGSDLLLLIVHSFIIGIPVDESQAWCYTKTMMRMTLVIWVLEQVVKAVSVKIMSTTSVRM